jgi:hypothetical protein
VLDEAAKQAGIDRVKPVTGIKMKTNRFNCIHFVITEEETNDLGFMER